MKNKKGWIKILEAFISILIVISVILIVYNNKSSENEDLSSKINPIEMSILRDVQLDTNLREKILLINSSSLPVKWEEFDSYGLSEVKEKINAQVPSNLECVAKLCVLEEYICDLDTYSDKDIYAQSISITANSDIYSPKQLKLFCYVR